MRGVREPASNVVGSAVCGTCCYYLVLSCIPFCILIGTKVGKLSNFSILTLGKILLSRLWWRNRFIPKPKQFTHLGKLSIQFRSSETGHGNYVVSSIINTFHHPFPGKWFRHTRGHCETFSILTTIFRMVNPYRPPPAGMLTKYGHMGVRAHFCVYAEYPDTLRTSWRSPWCVHVRIDEYWLHNSTLFAPS